MVSSFNNFKMHAWSTSMLLHSAFMLSMVKMLLKGEVGGRALNSHGNYIADHGKAWKNHGIVVLSFCGNPEPCCQLKKDTGKFIFIMEGADIFFCTISMISMYKS